MLRPMKWWGVGFGGAGAHDALAVQLGAIRQERKECILFLMPLGMVLLGGSCPAGPGIIASKGVLGAQTLPCGTGCGGQWCAVALGVVACLVLCVVGGRLWRFSAYALWHRRLFAQVPFDTSCHSLATAEHHRGISEWVPFWPTKDVFRTLSPLTSAVHTATFPSVAIPGSQDTQMSAPMEAGLWGERVHLPHPLAPPHVACLCCFCGPSTVLLRSIKVVQSSAIIQVLPTKVLQITLVLPQDEGL